MERKKFENEQILSEVISKQVSPVERIKTIFRLTNCCFISGDLANVQRSIPLGTISAVLFTTFIYIILVFCYAGSVNSLLLRDKFGQSIGGRLVAAEIAWPHPMVLLVGATM